MAHMQMLLGETEMKPTIFSKKLTFNRLAGAANVVLGAFAGNPSGLYGHYVEGKTAATWLQSKMPPRIL
tara:strand:+ start:757 stop:963 length:207 start_codon:yes stop_codon:yes gene_type:complete